MEPDKKPTLLQRFTIKRFVKQHRKQIDTLRKKNDVSESEYKKRIISSLLEMGQIFDMTYDSGVLITEESFNEMKLSELIDIYDKALKELGKII